MPSEIALDTAKNRLIHITRMVPIDELDRKQ